MNEQLKQAIEELFPKSDDSACNKRMSYRRYGANTALSTPFILRHADPEIMKQAGWLREEETNRIEVCPYCLDKDCISDHK